MNKTNGWKEYAEKLIFLFKVWGYKLKCLKY